MDSCCTHKVGKDTTSCSVGNQPHYVEAAVIIVIMLIQLRKTGFSGEVAFLGVAAQNNAAAVSGAQRGNITDVYLSLPRQLPAFMPLPCLSSIVQTKCCCLL